jgi:predicted AAA+ superfamily ATPase
MVLTRDFHKKLSSRLREKRLLIQVVIGPRQVGKTTAAEEIFEQYKGPKHFVSADSPSPFGPEWIEAAWTQALRKSSDCLLIIDEIQKVVNWSEEVKRLFDKYRRKTNLKVVLLGSSSLYLHKGLGDSLTGRFELINAPHWSFKEFQDCFQWDWQTFFKFGAYPGAEWFITNPSRWTEYILNSIVEPIISRDILDTGLVHNPALFRQTFELAAKHPAKIISYQKLLGQLQDKGNAATIKNYLSLLEKTYLLKSLQKYSGSKFRTVSSSPKIVILNHAISNAFSSIKTEQDECFLFESIVGAHLSLLPESELYYWKHGNYEVDYILKKDRVVYAIEIKSGRKKNTKSLQEFKRVYPKSQPLIWGLEECIQFMQTLAF